MTTSHLRGKFCCDISWVVLTQSLVIWWKKMDRGQATVGNCCTRAFFSFVAPVKSYSCPNSLLITHLDLRLAWWSKGHVPSYFFARHLTPPQSRQIIWASTSNLLADRIHHIGHLAMTQTSTLPADTSHLPPTVLPIPTHCWWCQHTLVLLP